MNGQETLVQPPLLSYQQCVLRPGMATTGKRELSECVYYMQCNRCSANADGWRCLLMKRIVRKLLSKWYSYTFENAPSIFEKWVENDDVRKFVTVRGGKSVCHPQPARANR